MRLQAGRVLGGDDALVGGLVGERRAVHEVTDRVDALQARTHRAVDLDETVLVELDAGLAEAEGLDVRSAPGGDDEVVDLGRLVAVGEGDAAVAGLDVLDERLREDLHALALEPALGEL